MNLTVQQIEDWLAGRRSPTAAEVTAALQWLLRQVRTARYQAAQAERLRRQAEIESARTLERVHAGNDEISRLQRMVDLVLDQAWRGELSAADLVRQAEDLDLLREIPGGFDPQQHRHAGKPIERGSRWLMSAWNEEELGLVGPEGPGPEVLEAQRPESRTTDADQP